MFKTSHLRFWLASKSYYQSQIGLTISHSCLYHQSWTIDSQISCFWSYKSSCPLTIGRATSRRTSRTIIRTTCCAIQCNRSPNQSLHAIKILYLTKHSRSVVCTSIRQKSHDQHIVLSCMTIALLAQTSKKIVYFEHEDCVNMRKATMRRGICLNQILSTLNVSCSKPVLTPKVRLRPLKISINEGQIELLQ